MRVCKTTDECLQDHWWVFARPLMSVCKTTDECLQDHWWASARPLISVYKTTDERIFYFAVGSKGIRFSASSSENVMNCACGAVCGRGEIDQGCSPVECYLGLSVYLGVFMIVGATDACANHRMNMADLARVPPLLHGCRRFHMQATAWQPHLWPCALSAYCAAACMRAHTLTHKSASTQACHTWPCELSALCCCMFTANLAPSRFSSSRFTLARAALICAWCAAMCSQISSCSRRLDSYG